MDQSYDLIVIGAGISGLGTAHMCGRKGMKTLVLEGSERAGGCLHSVATEQGFWQELGAHTVYNSYGQMLSLVDDLGLRQHLQQKAKMPYRLFGEEGVASIFSRLGFIEAGLHLPNLLRLKRADHSVADFYSRVFGKNNYQRLLHAAFDAVSCQDSADMPADALFRKKPRRKDYPRLFTFAGGLQTLVQGLVDGRAFELKLGHSVTDIQRINHLYQVETNHGKVFQAPRVALATPVAQASQLLREINPQAARLLSSIGHSVIESIAVTLPAGQTSLEPLAGLIGLHQPFFSMVSRDPIADADWRGFSFHFRPHQLSQSEQLQFVRSLLEVPPDLEPLAQYGTKSLPALRMGHAQLMARLQSAIDDQPLALVGNYFLGISIEDCLLRARVESDRLLQREP